MTIKSGSDWTISVDGGTAIPCEFVADMQDGLRCMRFTVWASLLEQLGQRVRFRLAGGSRSADGEGVVTEVRSDDIGDRSTLIVDGPLRMAS